jgi:hypothetical protein
VEAAPRSLDSGTVGSAIAALLSLSKLQLSFRPKLCLAFILSLQHAVQGLLLG